MMKLYKVIFKKFGSLLKNYSNDMDHYYLQLGIKDPEKPFSFE